MNTDSLVEKVVPVLIVLVVALGLIGIPVLVLAGPYFESRAFNRFTEGPKATYWDALWTDLKVTAR
jgi:hypothetical protein